MQHGKLEKRVFAVVMAWRVRWLGQRSDDSVLLVMLVVMRLLSRCGVCVGMQYC